jgi:ferric-dicitrate binding protein FerR (iron transport regulator)
VRIWTPDRVLDPVPHVELATVDIVRGAVRLAATHALPDEPTLLRTGDRLRTGDGVDTSAGGVVGVRLSNGALVRVDRGTRLRFMSETALALDEGTIYVASNGARGAPTLEVRTAVGVARDIGTRFEVRFDGSALRVRVREGKVRVSQSREAHEAARGEELTLAGDGTIARRTIAPSSPEWAWASALAVPFALEGRSLREFLDWVVGETGWQLRFADADLERRAEKTLLHGSIEGLGPEQALAAVLPASGVEHRIDEGALLIRRIADDPTP